MPLSSSVEALVNFLASRQLLPGSWANAINNQLYSIQTVTASTTQTQAGGTKITSAAAAVTTANANNLGVFPAVGDTIFPSAQNAVLAQTLSKNAVYKCIKVTASGAATWYRNLSA